jgi:hypothetical protein
VSRTTLVKKSIYAILTRYLCDEIGELYIHFCTTVEYLALSSLGRRVRCLRQAGNSSGVHVSARLRLKLVLTLYCVKIISTALPYDMTLPLLKVIVAVYFALEDSFRFSFSFKTDLSLAPVVVVVVIVVSP